MAPTIDFEVTQDGTYLGIESRPVRLLPDGDYGVVYGGRVHRLNTRSVTEEHARIMDPSIGEWAAWEIDLSHTETFSKSQCPPLNTFRGSPFINDAKLDTFTETVSIDWYLEENPNRRYIALDADDTSIEEIIDNLSNYNVAVISHGRSRRVASNGRMYDWFVRLPLESVSGLSEARLRQILDSVCGTLSPLFHTIQALDLLGISLTTDGTTIFYRGNIAYLTPDLSEAVKNRKSDLIEFLMNNGFVESRGEYESGEVVPKFDPENAVTMIMGELLDAGISGEFGEKFSKRLREKLDSDEDRDEGDSLLHARDIFLQGINSLGQELVHLNTLRQSDAEEKQSIERHLIEAREKIESLQNSPSEITEPVPPLATKTDHSELLEEKNRLEAKLASTQQDLDDAMTIWKSEQSQVEDLDDQNQRLSKRVGRLQRQLESVGETAELVETILINATPRIVYRLSSIDTLSEFTDPSATIRMLRGLDDQSLAGGSNVGGAPGWREHHVSTGDSDDGRLYYKTIDSRVNVLIGKKGSQRRDIRRLRQL